MRQFARTGGTASKLTHAHAMGDIYLTRRHAQEVRATVLALLDLLYQSHDVADEAELYRLIETLRDLWDDPRPGDTGL